MKREVKRKRGISLDKKLDELLEKIATEENRTFSGFLENYFTEKYKDLLK